MTNMHNYRDFDIAEHQILSTPNTFQLSQVLGMHFAEDVCVCVCVKKREKVNDMKINGYSFN